MQYSPRTIAAIAAASLLAAVAAQANKGAEYKPHHHKEHHKNFFITGGATYLEPSFNGLDYLTISEESTVPGSIPYLRTRTVEPEFNWGYFIQAGYRISHHYDVEASWAQYNSSLSNSSTGTGVAGTTTTATSSNEATYALTTGETATAEAKQNINYSIFDANLGQYHDITEMLRARLFAGIQYGKVDLDVDNTYALTVAPLAAFDNYDSSFSGWGPELGMDLEYKVWHTIGVVGHFAAAFLIGQQETESYVYNDSIPATQASIATESVARLIPTINAKLGANWNVPYAYEKISFGIEAGYQVAYYWNVIDEVQYPAYSDAVQHNYSNYGNMGPYLNLTAMF
jgi:hypothetical protein